MTTGNERVIVFDTTLRDGEQSPGASLNVKEKLEIAKQLARLGVDVIEGGFPKASPGDLAAVKLIAKEVKGPQICGLARALIPDIDACWEAVKASKNPRIHTFIATSDIHLRAKLRKSRAEVLDLAVAAVRHAKRYTPNVEFSPEDAARSDFEYLCQVLEAVIEAGAATLNIPDTVGYAVPAEFGEFIGRIRQRVRNIHRVVISVHCHNDLGLAVANSLAAVQHGARQVECTMNGIGERAGNASLEEVVIGLHTRKALFGVSTNVQLKEIYRTSRLVSTLTGIPVQPNKAVVGSNAFAHESGIHQDGIIKERQTYEIFTPESVGVPASQLILGKHSGRHALVKRLKDLGYVVPPAELDRIFEQFKALADKKKYIFDEDILALVEEAMADITETYTLDYLHTSSGSGVVPTATVRLKVGGKVIQEAACGDGPVDAAYRAIDKIASVKPTLLDYGLRALSGGKDALGEVTVKVEDAGLTIVGRGASTDIISASAKAYLNALNKILMARSRRGRAAGRIQEKV